MAFRVFVSVGLLIFYLAFTTEPVYAQNADLPDVSALTEHMAVVSRDLGEELRCFAIRSGQDVSAIAVKNRILLPSKLALETSVLVPDVVNELRTAGSDDSILLAAVRSGLSEYTLRAMNHMPLYPGGLYILPGNNAEVSHLEQPCLPYPLLSLNTSKNPITRGETLVVVLEFAEPVFCEVQFLNRIEPCYTSDEITYYALIGVSALAESGFYTIQLLVDTSDGEVRIDFPLQITPGQYGFQYINPPATLYELLDQKIFTAEESILEPYREIRTPFRMWDIPLGFPLTVQVPISADFGDRRSYGGMFDGYHSGVDYRAWSYLPILAPADGVVVLNQYLKARGNAVIVDHGWGVMTGFWHLSSSNVAVGQVVSKGEIIGKVGNTGLSTGSHLHWETWVNGVSVDGKQWLHAVSMSDVPLFEGE